MELNFINTEYEKELNEVLRLFFPTFENNESHIITFENKENSVIVAIDEKTYSFDKTLKKDKNSQKHAFYSALSTHFGKTFEWGSITGVRPTKLAYELLENGTPKHLLKETLMKDYSLSPAKAKLLRDVISNQNCIIKNDSLVDIFVNIPICPSRCKYCSFISSEECKIKNIIPKYVECLIKEINETKKIIKETKKP